MRAPALGLVWLALWGSAAAGATEWSVRPSCVGVAYCFTNPMGSTLVNGRTVSLAGRWSFFQPGDVLVIYPAANGAAWLPTGSLGSAPALNIDSARGTAMAPIKVMGAAGQVVKLGQGLNITNGTQHLQVSGLDITDPRPGRHAVVIDGGSSDIVLRANRIHDAALNGLNITPAAGPRLLIGPDNVLANNRGNGAAIGASGLNPITGALGSYFTGNTVTGNGRHGVSSEASYWSIERNQVLSNGTLVGGTSGIHLFSPSDNAAPDCDGNVVAYNYVNGQQDSQQADGNGIQIDHFCDYNIVAFNVAWGNAGAGISLLVGRGNYIVANTVGGNATDTNRLRFSGVFRAEIGLASSTSVCYNNDDYGQCLGWLPVPAGRSGGNFIYGNLVYSTQAAVPAIGATPDFSDPARHSNALYPNLFFNGGGGANLLWRGVGYSTVADIDRVTGMSAYGGGNAVEVPAFANPGAPGKGSDGLRLLKRPSQPGWSISPGTPDLLGKLPFAGGGQFGAYYSPP
ncbi:right-handed parallel beta-helix repeat-containing protein [Ideonella paludis]|uniref:Right-handed parallel beta-helix repeat-containing protein n=1 Tax=Ideonella paludis TaxID=1233411 RepID=A0ABS5E2R3_9BURK|nr:right-handed parallel beta-helix repeat-containing protein [Ideonella paludis]MBQ0937715.1 right-handed parallel beta-helix repeat-containing protein [Ideonella paludis]